MNDARSAVREFLARHLRGHQLQDHEDIFALGLVNSMFAMQLVAFVERRFELTVEDGDLDIDNFRSIDAVAGFVARKTDRPAERPA